MMTNGERRSRRGPQSVLSAEKQRDAVASHVRAGHVAKAIAVSVSDGDANGESSGLERGAGRLLEGSITIAKQNSDCIVGRIRALSREVNDRQVGFPVAIYIANRHTEGTRIGFEGRAWRLRKAAFAIAKQNGDVAAFKVRSDNVVAAVFINICTANSLIGHLADRKRNSGRSKVSLAVAKHYRDAIVSPIVNHKIQIVIAVEVSEGDAVRMRPTVDSER